MADWDPLVNELFLRALAAGSASERAAVLDESCTDDVELRRKIEALLKAHDAAGSFLERPAPGLASDPEPGTHAARTLVAPDAAQPTQTISEGIKRDSQPGEPTQTAHSSPSTTFEPARNPIAEGPGSCIGPYKLLQEIGEGGMGVVYMAEQERPVRRKVALKIIKPGMDTGQVVARFEAERQALALMDHPSIARVFDAGSTESGRPYFVMELVNGVPITEYCDTQELTPRERLELFVPVCRAIQHAHQKGIIHRDVKPSNVLITLVDGRPTPKVIDFGIAKATGQRLTERSLFTQFGAIVGTLEYMSPEQAELSSQDVDTRSDVYSLGVLLYELLTGSTPLERARLRQAGYAEILRRIREEEPPRPSARLSGSGEALPSIAARRHTEPARLARLVRGELDWIVMRSLEKDRTRRYESAGGFARDVERFLSDEAVEACPPSRRYRIAKFARRHRAALSTAAAFAVLLVVAASVSTLLAIRARAAEVATRSEADKVKAINEFLTDDILTQAEPGKNAVESKVTLRDVLDRAAARVGQRFHGQPAVEAALRRAMSRTYHGLGAWASAEQQTFAQYELERRLHGDDGMETLVTLGELGHIYDHLGRPEEAVKALRQASDGLGRRLGPEHLNSIASTGSLVEALESAGQTAEATALNEQALKRSEAGLGSDHRLTVALRSKLASFHEAAGRAAGAAAAKTDKVKMEEAALGPDHPNTLADRGDLAESYRTAGRTGEAIAIGEDTLKRMTSRLGPDHNLTLGVRHNLALAYMAAARVAEAIPLLEKTLEGMTAVLGPDHPKTLTCRSSLAGAYWMAGRMAEALAVQKETLKRLTDKLGPDHPQTLAARGNLATAYLATGQTAEAVPLLEQTLKGIAASSGADHPSTLTVRNNLASAYQMIGRGAEAIAMNEETLRLATSKLGPDHPATLQTRDFLARLFEFAQRFGDAESQRRAILESHRRRRPAEPPDLAEALSGLGLDLLEQQKFDEARTLLRESLDIREKAFPDEWPTFETRSLLGASLLGLKQYGEAEPLVVSGYEGMKAREAKIPAAARPNLDQALGRVTALYEAWGKPEKAEEWRRKVGPGGSPPGPPGRESKQE